MDANLEFRKEILSPPGDTIQETIDELGMTQAELAQRMGRSKEKLNELIKGKEPLTRKTAVLLDRVLGIPVSFWMNRENDYREELLKIEQLEFLEKCVSWVKEFPLKELKALGFLPDTKDKHKLADALLRFFRVATPEEWEAIYVKDTVSASFKVSLKNTRSPHAISAWLRAGEVKAQEMDLPVYDKALFKKVLNDLKEVVKEHPQDYRILLQEASAKAGVAVLFTPALPKAPISGATWWRGNTPIIQLTGRFRANDRLWFDFYHEAGHVLLHGKKDIFLEDLKGTETDKKKEHEANRFAQKQLFPKEALQELMQQALSKELILKYAQRYKTHPGVVVGQLQHAEYLEFSEMNELKEPVNLYGEEHE